MAKVYIDLTTLARWRGTLTGIQRCQKIYASHALAQIADVRFTLFDPETRWYRHLDSGHARRILEGTLRADMMLLPDLNQHRRHFVDRLPKPLRPLYWWLTKTRRMAIAKLEAIRFADKKSRRGQMAAALQSFLFNKREKADYLARENGQIDRPPFSIIAGEPVLFERDDVVIAMQNDWAHTDIVAIAEQKRKTGWHHVILCHDLIPILFPHWYKAPDVVGFTRYYDHAFAAADRVIFTSKRTLEDARGYCSNKGIALEAGPVVPMGGDFAGAAILPPLPAMLEAGKFALFVSTIEPRKNHVMLVAGWRRLAASGLIADSGFKLVFAGNLGWHMDGFLDDIANDEAIRGTIIHIRGADDGLIARLYADAAFCLYPPLYEGFGLPIVEALVRGKALIASSAGPMEEIAGGFARSLDPEDTEGWTTAIAEWIRHPEEAERFAERARDSYVPVSWDESARRFFDAALAPFANN